MSSMLEQSLDEIIGARAPAAGRRGNRAPKPRHQNRRRAAPRAPPRSAPPRADGRPTLIKVSNLHPDLTAQDLHRLFSSVGPVVDVSLRVNTHGKALGVAFVEFEYGEDAMHAIREYDGRLAAGQIISVTTTMPLADRIGTPRGAGAGGVKGKGRARKRGGAGAAREKKAPKSLEDLDKELNAYMSGGAEPEPAPEEAPAAPLAPVE